MRNCICLFPNCGHCSTFILLPEEIAADDQKFCAGTNGFLRRFAVDSAVHLDLIGQMMRFGIAAERLHFFIISRMKDCPPKPGSTVMTSTTSTESRYGMAVSHGVSGLSTMPAFAPAS